MGLIRLPKTKEALSASKSLKDHLSLLDIFFLECISVLSMFTCLFKYKAEKWTYQYGAQVYLSMRDLR